MRFSGLRPLVLGVAIALGAGACSSTTAPSVDLSGNYGLVSIQFGQGTALTPPGETGTFSLSATAYSLSLSGSVSETDTGTYTISGGSTWSQTSSTQGFTSSGTYSLSGTTLTVTTTQQGTAVVAVWEKLS